MRDRKEDVSTCSLIDGRSRAALALAFLLGFLAARVPLASASSHPEIADASATYPGHGFDVAFGKDTRDYVAGYPANAHHVTLRFSRPKRWGGIGLVWYSERDHAGRIRVSVPTGRWSRELIVADGSPTIVLLKDSPESDEWRLDFSDYRGQPRLLLRSIRLVAADDEAGLEALHDMIPWRTADDPANPLRLFRLPISRRVHALSEQLASGASTQHEQVVRWMRHMRDFRTGFASDANPEATLLEQVGACGTFTVALLGLAAAQGIDGRVINMMNYPVSEGHTVAELHVDGDWRVYDPTYVAWYSDRQARAAEPLSYEAIRALCRDDEGRVRLHADSDRPGLAAYTGCGPYTKANPAGIIGHGRPMVFPLLLDLGMHDRIVRADFGTRYQGADYIGAAQMNQMQSWTLTGLQAGRVYHFVLLPQEIGGEWEAGEDKSIEVTARVEARAGSIEHRHVFRMPLQEWRIEFVAESKSMQIMLTHPYRGPESRYVQMRAYRLELAGTEEGATGSEGGH